jgi:hypothetical protein
MGDQMDDTFAEDVDQWREAFKARRAEQAKDWMNRCDSALSALGRTIAAWCQAQGRKPGELRAKLEEAEWFMQRLDEALHQQRGPFAEEKHYLWANRNLFGLYRSTKPSQRESFINLPGLEEVVTEYLGSP